MFTPDNVPFHTHTHTPRNISYELSMFLTSTGLSYSSQQTCEVGTEITPIIDEKNESERVMQQLSTGGDEPGCGSRNVLLSILLYCLV